MQEVHNAYETSKQFEEVSSEIKAAEDLAIRNEIMVWTTVRGYDSPLQKAASPNVRYRIRNWGLGLATSLVILRYFGMAVRNHVLVILTSDGH